jgi:hypothetical protein
MVPPDLVGDARVIEPDPDDDVGSLAGVMVVRDAEFLATLGKPGTERKL